MTTGTCGPARDGAITSECAGFSSKWRSTPNTTALAEKARAAAGSDGDMMVDIPSSRVKYSQNLLGATPTVTEVPKVAVMQLLQICVEDVADIGPGVESYNQAKYRSNNFVLEQSNKTTWRRQRSKCFALCAFPNGTRVDLQLTGVIYSFYVQLPPFVNEDDHIKRVVKALERTITPNNPNARQSKIKYKVEERMHYAEWSPKDLSTSAETATFTYLVLAFDCPYIMDRAGKALKQGLIVDLGNGRGATSVTFDVQESRVDAAQKVYDLLSIRPMDWIRVDQHSIPALYYTHSAVELEVACKDVTHVPEVEGLAALNKVSWDIETYASTKNFSSPLRDGDFVIQVNSTVITHGADIKDALNTCHYNGQVDRAALERISNHDPVILDDSARSERDMLERWRDMIVLDVQPCQMFAWNNDTFDNPYIWYRSQNPADYAGKNPDSVVSGDDDVGTDKDGDMLDKFESVTKSIKKKRVCPIDSQSQDKKKKLHYEHVDYPSRDTRFCYLGSFIFKRCRMIERDKMTALSDDPVRHHEIHMEGRITMDLMRYIMSPSNMLKKYNEYNLKGFCEEFFKGDPMLRKVDLSAEQIWENHRRGATARAENVAYGTRDTVLPARIEHAVAAYATIGQISGVTCTPLQNTVSMGSQVRVSNLVLWYCHRNGRVVDKDSIEATESDGYHGAAVLEPKTGTYRRPVFVDDFQSLYPSIMDANNYCYSSNVRNPAVMKELVDNSTVIEDAPLEPPAEPQMHTVPQPGARTCAQAIADGPRPHIWAKLDEAYVPKAGDRPRQSQRTRRAFIPNSSVLCRHDRTGLLFRVVLVAKGKYHMFVQSEQGVLPQILAMLKAARKAVRAQLAKLDKKDPVVQVLEARQLAIKLIMNSIYGLTGASKSGKWSLIPVAESVTCSGREMIDFVVFCIQNDFHAYTEFLLIRNTFDAALLVQHDVDPKDYAPMHCEVYDRVVEAGVPDVVYGDTDSNMAATMLPLTDDGIKAAFVLSRVICEYISAMFPSAVVLEPEKVYAPFILQKKKRYAAMKWLCKWPHGLGGEPVLVREGADKSGIEAKRRDNFPLVRKVFNEALNLVLDKQDMDGALECIMNGALDIALDRIPMDMYVISKSLKRDYSKTVALPAQAVVRDKIAKRFPGTEPGEGTRVPYVITTEPAGHKVMARAESPAHLAGNTRKLDCAYYQAFFGRIMFKFFGLVYKGIDKPLDLALRFSYGRTEASSTIAEFITPGSKRKHEDLFVYNLAAEFKRALPIESSGIKKRAAPVLSSLHSALGSYTSSSQPATSPQDPFFRTTHPRPASTAVHPPMKRARTSKPVGLSLSLVLKTAKQSTLT